MADYGDTTEHDNYWLNRLIKDYEAGKGYTEDSQMWFYDELRVAMKLIALGYEFKVHSDTSAMTGFMVSGKRRD